MELVVTPHQPLGESSHCSLVHSIRSQTPVLSLPSSTLPFWACIQLPPPALLYPRLLPGMIHKRGQWASIWPLPCHLPWGLHLLLSPRSTPIPGLPSGSTQHLPLPVCIFFLIQIHTPATRLTVRTTRRMPLQSQLLWTEPGVKGQCQICLSQACWVGSWEEVGSPWLRACIPSVHPWCNPDRFPPF